MHHCRFVIPSLHLSESESKRVNEAQKDGQRTFLLQIKNLGSGIGFKKDFQDISQIFKPFFSFKKVFIVKEEQNIIWFLEANRILKVTVPLCT